MNLTITARLAYHFAEACEVLLLVEAARCAGQTVQAETLTFTPELEVARLDDAANGERRVVFTGHGRVDIAYDARVEVIRAAPPLAGLAASAVRDLPPEALPYLRASRYCPSDEFCALVAAEFPGLEGGDLAAAILDWIHDNIAYRMGVSDSMTTALDTYVARAGVCRDFTHLAVTLLRAANIPARAVSAHAWKLDPPDLHAVVELWLDGAWRLADPTRLAPVEGLVRIATGLDAADIAFMSIFGAGELIEQSFAVSLTEG